jgi:hypothetical protein
MVAELLTRLFRRAPRRREVLDAERQKIADALGHIRSRGNLDDFAGTRTERLALITTASKQGLISWAKARSRFELTSAGEKRLAMIDRAAAAGPARPARGTSRATMVKLAGAAAGLAGCVGLAAKLPAALFDSEPGYAPAAMAMQASVGQRGDLETTGSVARTATVTPAPSAAEPAAASVSRQVTARAAAVAAPDVLAGAAELPDAIPQAASAVTEPASAVRSTGSNPPAAAARPAPSVGAPPPPAARPRVAAVTTTPIAGAAIAAPAATDGTTPARAVRPKFAAVPRTPPIKVTKRETPGAGDSIIVTRVYEYENGTRVIVRHRYSPRDFDPRLAYDRGGDRAYRRLYQAPPRFFDFYR